MVNKVADQWLVKKLELCCRAHMHTHTTHTYTHTHIFLFPPTPLMAKKNSYKQYDNGDNYITVTLAGTAMVMI